MANMTPGDPLYASDYDDRTTATVKTVLVEIEQAQELSMATKTQHHPKGPVTRACGNA